MNWNRIVFKLGGAMILLVLVILLPLGFVIDRIVYGFYYGKVEEDIDQLASSYAQSIEASPNQMTIRMVEMMGQFSKEKFYIVDVQGNTIAQSNIPRISKKVSNQEITDLADGKVVKKIVSNSESKDRFLVSGHPIIQRNTFLGAVYVLSSIEEIKPAIQEVRNMILLSGIGAFFLALSLTWVISRKFSIPLIQMENTTRQIAKGKLDSKVKVMSRDEIGSLAQAINDLALDLDRYQETRKELFSNISHELRTPITSLKGYTRMLKEKGYETEEEKNQILDFIGQESERMDRLIEDVFDLSKMEVGKANLQLEWIDLTEIIEHVVRKTAWKAEEKGLKIKMEVPLDLPLFYGDGLRMEQILINLLENAIMYTEKGVITLRATTDQHQLLISIEDTGIGIPEEELPHIFERFYRVEKSRSRKHGGTGLGLAIVKQLVELQGGAIQVFSQTGKGTRFELVFPIDQENWQEK